MKSRFRPRTWILSGAAVAVATVLFVGTQKMCGCGEDARENALASNAIPDTSQSVDLTSDTVLLKLPAEENQAPLEVTLKQLMDTYKVPGLSAAVIDNYQIAWAKGFGVTEPGGNTPVTTKTLFQAGSISKPVAAVGAMWLVEHGKLSLDEDVTRSSRAGRSRERLHQSAKSHVAPPDEPQRRPDRTRFSWVRSQ